MPGRPRGEFVVDPGALGARVHRIRTNRGIRTDAVAGVARSTLEQIEKGASVPSLDTAIKLASAFGCTLDDLVSQAVTDTTARGLRGRHVRVVPPPGGGADVLDAS